MSKHRKSRRLAAKLGVIAGAAVVGTDRAEAEVVRARPFLDSPSSSLRPPSNSIPGGSAGATSSASTLWDLDGDATDDFRLVNFMQGQLQGADQLAGAQILARFEGNTAGAAWVKVSPTDELRRLQAGDTVGPNKLFGGIGSVIANAQTGYLFPGTSEGEPTPSDTILNQNWNVGESGFFGFKFEKDGSDYYGWGRLEIDLLDAGSPYPRSGYGFAITDAYYDASPNTPITVGVVPEPSSMALLGAGAAGVAAWKARRKLRGADERTAVPQAAA